MLRQVPLWRKQWALDFVIVNGENAASGFGITLAIAEAFAPVSMSSPRAITFGTSRKFKAILTPKIACCAKFPIRTPGIGANLFQAGDQRVMVVTMGQLFAETWTTPLSPLSANWGLSVGRGADAIIVDVHAEATSEKMAMGYFYDGRESLVVGTYTHVPTADTQILPNGTAYQTDAGMCGDYDSVIGMEKEEPQSASARNCAAGALLRHRARRRFAAWWWKPTTKAVWRLILRRFVSAVASSTAMNG